MAGQAHRWLSALVILSPLSGCDNVEWGGAEIELRAPPGGDSAEVDDTLRLSGDEGAGMPEGPVLYLGRRDGPTVTVVPVAEITDTGLSSLPDDEDFRSTFARERMEDMTFTLFAEGLRVGTVRAEGTTTDRTFCTPRAAAFGTLEVVPEAAEVERFVALAEEEEASARAPYGSFEVLEDDLARRQASIDIAGAIIPEVGAEWPTSMTSARAEIRAVELSPDGPPAFTSTFLFRDRPGIGAAEERSWALFLVGVRTPSGYEEAFRWFRPVDPDGRGVPLLYQHFDWSGDGTTDLLLEVLGEESRWIAAVSRVDGGWTRLHQDACGEAPTGDH